MADKPGDEWSPGAMEAVAGGAEAVAVCRARKPQASARGDLFRESYREPTRVSRIYRRDKEKKH